MESSVFRKAALIAAACTTVQAVTWIGLSLVGLLTSTAIILPPQGTKSSDAFPAYMVLCYFSAKTADPCCNDLVMRDTGMLAISIVYMVLSIAWFCTSVLLLQDLQNARKHVSHLTMSWAGVTLVTSVLDFVVVILFGVDYAKMNSVKVVCPLSVPGFLMSLAARGYVLWLLNVVVSVWLFFAARNVTVSRRSSKASSDDSDNYHNPLDAVTQESRSMVFHGGVERPWAGQDPRAAKSVNAWDQGDSGFAPNVDVRSPPPVTPGTQRGGLAQRMAQSTPTHTNPMSPQTSYQNPTSPFAYPQRTTQPPPQQPSNYPAPDYDSRAAVPPRSALKKPPPLVIPPPAAPNNGNMQSWRQQVQQPDNRWQQGSGYGGGGGGAGYGGGGGGGAGYGGGGGGGGGGRGYDNRGYDGGRTGF